MTIEEWQAIHEITDALLGIKQRLSELTDAVSEITRAIERAAEEMRDAK